MLPAQFCFALENSYYCTVPAVLRWCFCIWTRISCKIWRDDFSQTSMWLKVWIVLFGRWCFVREVDVWFLKSYRNMFKSLIPISCACLDGWAWTCELVHLFIWCGCSASFVDIFDIRAVMETVIKRPCGKRYETKISKWLNLDAC